MMVSLPVQQKRQILAASLIIFLSFSGYGQNDYNYFCRVYFRDKGANTPSMFTAEQLISQRAIERRTKRGIAFPEYSDLPVFSDYIQQITNLGFTLHCTSKWMNTALFKTNVFPDTAKVKSLSCVAGVKIVKKPAGKGQLSEKNKLLLTAEMVTPYNRPLTMMNGNTLHASGFDGTGILVAILDAGFINGDIVPSLRPLRNRHGIIFTKDIVRNNQFVYSYHNHGTAILTTLAGVAPGYIEGTAPGADFILIRTEDPLSEFPVEEDFWAAGAELADSAGADIISSSLGYYSFDDPSMNYNYSEFNGKTAFVTRAADMAASKGILVVCSAGNERNKDWKHIIAPSDGDSVLCVGAVDSDNQIASFSSAGPSADRRIKPDNTAMGVNVICQTSTAGFTTASGTSLSCPVLSGTCACLLQAVPEATNMEIINALHYAGDRYYSPDSLYGYGTPNLLKALVYLQDIHTLKPDNQIISWPNPTSGEFEIDFMEPPESLSIEIFSSDGKLVFRKDYSSYAGRSIVLRALEGRKQGIFIIRLSTGKETFVNKIMKMN
jgi:serine protease AprX